MSAGRRDNGSASKWIDFELHGSKIVAQRMMDDGCHVTTSYGIHAVPKGDWIVRFPSVGLELPVPHNIMKALFRPTEESLRKRWSQA